MTLVGNWGTFSMSGGTIANNTAGGDGGGVFIMLSTVASFTMLGGEISGNTANEGGGVFAPGGDYRHISNPGAFTMSGGIITNNTAHNQGGGVYYTLAGFKELGGTISANTPTNIHKG